MLTPGERAQHPHGVGLVLRLAEHLALALDHRVKAADDVIGVFLGHGAGLGGGQSLGKVRRGIRRDLRLVHVAGDDSIVGGDKGHQLTPARTAGGKDQSHSVLPFWSIIKSRSVQSLPKQGVSRNFRKRALPESSLPPALRRHLPRRGRQGALGPLCEGAPPAGGGGENLAANAVYFPVCTACGIGQFIGGFKRCLPDRGNAELGDALTGLDGVGFVGQVHHRHAQLTAVVAVNDTDAVRHAETVLDGQAAAGVDKGNALRAGQLDGKAGGHEGALHRGQRQRCIQHRAQVRRRRAGRSVLRHNGAGIQFFVFYNGIHKAKSPIFK